MCSLERSRAAGHLFSSAKSGWLMLSVTALSEANLNGTHSGHRVVARIDDVHSACLYVVPPEFDAVGICALNSC